MFIPVCNSAPRVSRSNSGRKRAIGERRDTRQVVRPILSELYDQKQMRAVSVEQTEVQSRTNIRPHQRHPLPPPRILPRHQGRPPITIYTLRAHAWRANTYALMIIDKVLVNNYSILSTAVPQLFRTAQAEDSQWVPSSWV